MPCSAAVRHANASSAAKPASQSRSPCFSIIFRPFWAARGCTHLARLALDRKCGRFEWSVLDWNQNAIGFYQGLGADVMPDWRICRVTGAALDALAADGPTRAG